MIDWKYNPENYETKSYELIPAGDYPVEIEEAAEQVSQSGKDMIRLKLKVKGYNTPLWYYMVFDNSTEEMRKRTDQRLGAIYESFEIERGNVNVDDWKGKRGGVRVKHRADNKGEMRSEVHYFLGRKKVKTLPAWEDEGTQAKDDFDFGRLPSIENEADTGIPF